MTDVSKTLGRPGDRPRLVVGITGASGVVYGLRALDACRELGVESHLVLSKSAALTLSQETGLSVADVNAKADVVHRAADVGASIASGSFRTLGMIVAPCSVRTMSEIATGVTSSLLSRAADVTLKERRTLVLMVRETPLHLGHLRTLTKLAEMGAVIAPPLPAFYAKPVSIAEMVDQSVGRTLDLFDLSWRPVKRWGEDLETLAGAAADRAEG
ncbi:UbiX family flavin prenyltransferase [Caulobacter sp.]|uniref:UbiX family flavin prenyltransferase n=1 Tax=Caulobacter sp. TaxID=78 RepID=UPI002B47E52B|nr:UbiX family flavin prenyltransferase [Caulobacter sp.]HJV42338.1 UbiX family flavin prenyltransferase [Caulobacter sp.]